ncbi:MAG: prefoldin subunit alpha [Candidatus Woesearchaeota archaeon]|nr:prefoldin subunit alpha [Candidatus Woesearchaeota archaeon]
MVERSEKASREEIRAKFLELQIIDQQVRQIQKQIEAIESQLTELDAVSESLDNFNNLKPGVEALVPLASGIYAKAEIKENKRLIINIGSGVAVEKTIPEIKKIIAEQIGDITKARDEILAQLQQFVAKAERLQNEIKESAKKIEK